MTVRMFSTEEQWQAERLLGIGASEAAAVLGIDPWKSALELWALKTGQVDIINRPDCKTARLLEG